MISYMMKLPAFMKKNIHGFTLIELLIVISIIGILSTFFIVNVQVFRTRSRDGQRKKDLRTVQTALELYRTDAGAYPASPLPTCNQPLRDASATITYLAKFPCDPNTNTAYTYSVSGSTYSLYACLENSSDADKDSTKQTSCTTASFTVTNP